MKALSPKAEARYARKGASDTYFVRVSAFSMLQNILPNLLTKVYDASTGVFLQNISIDL